MKIEMNDLFTFRDNITIIKDMKIQNTGIQDTRIQNTEIHDMKFKKI